MNIIILVGFIASMLGLQVSPTGAKYLRFDLAVKNSAANNNSTTFVKCVAFGKTAEFIATFFKVGSPIGVIAEVRNNNYTDANDVKHYSYEFCVWKASFVGRKVDNPAAVVAGTVAQPSAQPVQTASVAGGKSFQPVPGSTQVSTPAFGIPQVAAGGCAQFPAGSPASNAPEQGIIFRKLEDVFTQGEMKIVDSDESADE